MRSPGRKETDPASRERLAKREKELAELKSEGDALKARWQAEKQNVQHLRATYVLQAERLYVVTRFNTEAP